MTEGIHVPRFDLMEPWTRNAAVGPDDVTFASERVARRQKDAAADILDVLPSAVILADCDRRVQYLNVPARSVLESTGILHLAGDKIMASTPEAHDELRSAVELVCNSDREDFKIVRLETETGEAHFATVSAHPHAEGARQALIVLRLRRREAMAEQLKALFSLTNAEADLALRLADGDSLQEIAQARGIRPSTAKSQLRSIFTKLDCSRQARIVSIINNMVLPFNAN
jgi:DNA-binding CsgD family transcriptional regulator